MPEPKWSGRMKPPDSGGATTLTELTDVTGTPGPNKAPVYDADTGIAPLTEIPTQADLDQVLADVARTDWINLELLSGFNNIGDPWAVARYRRTLNSTVYLEGSIRNPDTTISEATWIPIAQLPEDSRPTAALEFDALTNDDAMSKIVVWPDGQVVWAGFRIGQHGTIDRLSLNNVNFSVG